MIKSLRNLALHNQRRVMTTAKTVTESYHNFAQHTGLRNGRFDMGGRQMNYVRLVPCGASMGSVGTCATVL